MYKVNQKQIDELLNIDLQNEVYIIDNFLDEKIAEDLYNYIQSREMDRTNSLFSDRYVLKKQDLFNNTSILSKWIEEVKNKDFLFNKIFQLKYKKRFYYLTGECTNVYKYGIGDYQKLHLDTDSGKGFDKLLQHNIGKDLGIHISLSKNWKKGDGGELVFYKKGSDGKLIQTQICEPKFNQLWI